MRLQPRGVGLALFWHSPCLWVSPRLEAPALPLAGAPFDWYGIFQISRDFPFQQYFSAFRLSPSQREAPLDNPVAAVDNWGMLLHQQTVDEILAEPMGGVVGVRRAASATVLRELTADEALDDPNRRGGDGSQVVSIARVRAAHHAVARELARGATAIEVSAITGYSPIRVANLKGDPTFQELIAHYRSQVDAHFENVVKKMTTLSADALDELSQRLDETPELFSVKELRELAVATLDRTGHSPVTKTQNTNVNIDASALAQLRARLAEGVVIGTSNRARVAERPALEQLPESGLAQGEDGGARVEGEGAQL